MPWASAMTEISDYGKPAERGPSSTLHYSFDNGFGGMHYYIDFKKNKATEVRSVGGE